MLELRNVCKSFGDVQVLDGVNFCLEKGFVYTLKGGNGSGKTTLINIISGFLKPDGGSIELKGEKITRYLPFRVNRMGVGRTFQDLRLATQMTVCENILLALEKRQFAYPSKEQQKRADEILETVSLSEKRNELALLDEPFARQQHSFPIRQRKLATGKLSLSETLCCGDVLVMMAWWLEMKLFGESIKI